MTAHTLSRPLVAARDTALRGLAPSTARSLAVAALTVGVVGDSLLREGPIGLAFGVFIGLIGMNLASLVWRDGRALPRESAVWLLAAGGFAFSLAWRNAVPLAPFDLLATAGCLAMAAVRLRDRRAGVLAARFRRTIAGLFTLAADLAVGLIPLVFRDLVRPAGAEPLSGRAKPIARAVMLAAVVVLVFGPLLRSADPIFASFVALPNIDFEDAFSHAVIIGFFAWLMTGWARGALQPTPERSVARYGFTIGLLDITTILATLDALFALFVVAQLGWIFGGEAFLRERTGLTASAYARQGFFQMVWIVALVVPVLVVTRSALGSGAALRRRHTLLSLPAIALLGAMIGSAFLRMNLYVQYFGLTLDRFYPIVFMGWLAFVLLWLAATVLRDRGRPFVAGALTSGLLTLAALNVVDPDAIIARVNAARSKIDVVHLAQLNGGAVPIATRVLVSQPQMGTAIERCNAAKTLMGTWGPSSRQRLRSEGVASWRTWNYDNARAMAAVAAHSQELRALTHGPCYEGASYR